jgi:plastocyanin
MNRRDTMAPLLIAGIAAVFLSMAPVFSFQTLSSNDTLTIPAPGQVNDTSPVTNRTFYINWGVETYVFDPSQIVVYEGDQVTLNILGVNGDLHDISVIGYVEQFELHRGELKIVTFTADRAGTIDFICSIHQPTMHGQILVLPRG